MARRRRGRGRIRDGETALAEKAQSRAVRGGGTPVPLDTSAQANSQAVFGPQSEWFGPGRPMSPMAPRSTSGRRYDFNFGQNYQITPRWDADISFRDLRFLADRYDLVRLAIETRKDQMSRLHWTIGIVDSEDDLTPEQDARATRYRKLLRRPDGEYFWADWLRMVLEDLLVIDAPSIFIQRTNDQEEVCGLFQIDGATVKPVIDNLGRTPKPPEAAYQQVLHGMPALNYTTRQLVYRPRNRRVHTVWGFSPVEQIIATVNIALRRQIWQHAYFTNGNIPDSLIGVPSTWTPDQIRDFQDWFDGFLSGDSERRRGAIFVPGEVAKSYVPTKDAEMFGHAEEWLARVVCFAFSIPHQALVKEINRATAENAAEQAVEDGLAPIMGWVKSLIDGILIDQFAETELEFKWVDDKELDPKVLDEIWAGRVDRGMADRNEWRAEVGMEARTEPEASMLMTSSLNAASPLSVDDSIAQTKAKQDAGIAPVPPAPGEQPGPADPGAAAPPPPGAKVPPKKPAPKKPAPAGKEAGGDFTKARKDRSADYAKLAVSRPKVERQRVKLEKALAAGLKRIGGRVVTAIEPVLERLLKDANDDRAEIITVALEGIGSLDFLIDATAEALETIAEDTVRVALAMIGSSQTADIFDQVSESAVEFARQRAAELVGKRILQNGDIVDNPDARWAITDSTRDMIKDTITRVLRENEGSKAIIEELQDAHEFSAARATMISRTEVASANSDAAMVSYRAARDAGVKIKKVWEPGPESCDECLANAEQGPIDLDETFDSGDDETPAHPNCECATLPEVEDD